MIIDLVLFGIMTYLLWWLLMAKPEGYPPGPPKWPILGNIVQVQKWGPQLFKSMVELRRRYGDVAGFFAGPVPVILVSGLDAIKEVSFRDDLQGRPKLLQHIVEKEINGILFVTGEKWKEQRRFTLRHLRDFGFGKSSMESISLEEVEAVFAAIDKSLVDGGREWSKPVVVHDILGTATINVLWHILAGKRYEFSDPELNQLLNYIKELITQASIGGKLDVAYPKLVVMFPFLVNLKDRKAKREAVLSFINKEIEEHTKTIDHTDPRDFFDIYLTEKNKHKDNAESTFTEKQLLGIATDLFAAGYDTTFNTTVFSLLFMILNPDVQRKVQEELDNVVGRDRFPSFEDRDRHRIPYTEATVMEILRCSTAVPLSVPHATLYAKKDVPFRGYLIPKNAQVLLNLYELHRDPEIWGDPQNFRPERFMNDERKIIRYDALIPFGTGKRSCLGEALARNNVFLFFACLMQRYSMRVPEGDPRPSDEPIGNITIMPKPFKIQVKLRH